MSTASKNLSEYDHKKIPDASGAKVVLLVSEWNSNITFNLMQGAKETLEKHGLAQKNIKVIYTPGSFELTFAAKRTAVQLKPDAIIALGSVIRGETPHFDFVCDAVTNGLMQVGIETGIPVILGVLTDNTLQQAIDRSGGKYGNKGVECAVAALKMIHLNKELAL